MRRVSLKRQVLKQKVKAIREQYAESHQQCQFFNCPKMGEQTHEIARGPSRGLSLGDDCALLRLCFHHHNWLHRHPIFEYGVAVKWFANDGTFDLLRLNELRGRAPGSVDYEDVRRATVDMMEILFREGDKTWMA